MKRIIIITLLLSGLYLGLHNGYIALWSTKSAVPEKVFPYRSAIYPQADQASLSHGITITSIEQLKALLEDFLS